MTSPGPSNDATSVDLTNCDREPIHLAGAVQPHGTLLAFQLGELTLQHRSANVSDWLKEVPEIGSALDSIFDAESTTLLRNVSMGIREVVRPLRLRPVSSKSSLPYSAAAHVYRGMLVVELEQPKESNHSAEIIEELSLPLQLTRANQRLQSCRDLSQLYQVIADEMRDISGFDRVMLYRFAEDNHGEVIGESVVAGRESFLGLHYPATDIPEQARRLYILNTVRSIGDVNAEPVPITPNCNANAERPLDLSLSCFRAVSPIHIEYLQNMGVRASMSISIVIDNRLWGLIACHHYSAKPLRLEERAACEIMGLVVGNYLSAREQAGTNNERTERRASFHRVLELVTRTANMWQDTEELWPEMKKVIDANGLVIVSQRESQCFGSTPPLDVIPSIVNWAEGNETEGAGPRYTHSLVGELAESTGTTSLGTCCGCLAVPLFGPEVSWLLFFRDEYVSEVSWAGNPDKVAVKTDDGVRLSPRQSFEEWKTTVHQQSRRWTQVDRDMAEELRHGLVELLSLRAAELTRLNDELAKINADLDSFAYAASHDLREPLRGISQTVFLLQHELGSEIDENTSNRLQTLAKLSARMDELIQGLLRLSRAGQGNLEFERVSLQEVAEEAVEMVLGRPHPKDVLVTIENDMTLWADFLCIRELFTNLVSNALKYNEHDVKHLVIGASANVTADGKREAKVFVRDNGIGIAPELQQEVFQIFRRLHLPGEYGGGSGAGLAICEKIVLRHGGRIWIESQPGTGSTVCFTLEQVS